MGEANTEVDKRFYIYRRQNIKVRERNMKKEIVEEDKKRETK